MLNLFCFLDSLLTVSASLRLSLSEFCTSICLFADILEADIGVAVPFESFEAGEGETSVFLTLVDFLVVTVFPVESGAPFDFFDKYMGVASLVALVDLCEGVVDGVGVATLDLFFPFVSRVDLLRFDVCVWVGSPADEFLFSLALAGEEEVPEAEAVSPSAPSLGAPPDRVFAIRSNASPDIVKGMNPPRLDY